VCGRLSSSEIIQLTTAMKHIVNVVEDPDHPGEVVLDFGPELCASLGWYPGDTMLWTDNLDGTWTLQKQPTQPGSTTS
jgi:hypothetical protein